MRKRLWILKSFQKDSCQLYIDELKFTLNCLCQGKLFLVGYRAGGVHAWSSSLNFHTTARAQNGTRYFTGWSQIKCLLVFLPLPSHRLIKCHQCPSQGALIQQKASSRLRAVWGCLSCPVCLHPDKQPQFKVRYAAALPPRPSFWSLPCNEFSPLKLPYSICSARGRID